MTDTTHISGAAQIGILRGDAAGVREKPRLAGQMGAGALMLTVLAFSAPIAVVQGFIPFTILFDGPGATFGFILALLLLLLFSVGYVAMVRSVPKPGDFYAFISSGLGNVVGLGAAFLAVAAYLTILAGVYIQLGVTVNALLQSIGLPQTSWGIWAFAGWALVSTLGYFHIELSAKILAVAMLIEVAIVMIFNVAVLINGGAEGLSVVPFTPSAFAEGDMAVTMLYAILVFMGFEATALFRDEVRDPDTTIPRATYGAVLFVGLLYTLSCYALTSAFGAQAWEVAKNAPASMFGIAIGRFVAPVFEQIGYFSVVLSVIAALISIHNVLSRYVLNLAVDKALPTALAKVHERHWSPHVASTAVAIVAAVLVLPFMIAGADGAVMYAMGTGIGSVGVIVLMALVSFSVIAWFWRAGIPKTSNVFKVFVAPAIAGVAMTVTVFYAIAHLELVVGGAPGENLWMLAVLLGPFLAGIALAAYFRAARPDTYQSLGRADRMSEFLARK
ncbi:APC family permease [Agrobacterium sp. SOY23]|uniref:APC family permease n=1 Tax=Agrobacterium sp. SOY23 TaxID=3014555 RepID=UPI0022AF9A6C|nr:APC family permease [Agrobacterium sp. SOY23]MCZ4433038.1 APC family permease [Agrobacterium sp. SOY23]